MAPVVRKRYRKCQGVVRTRLGQYSAWTNPTGSPSRMHCPSMSEDRRSDMSKKHFEYQSRMTLGLRSDRVQLARLIGCRLSQRRPYQSNAQMCRKQEPVRRATTDVGIAAGVRCSSKPPYWLSIERGKYSDWERRGMPSVLAVSLRNRCTKRIKSALCPSFARTRHSTEACKAA